MAKASRAALDPAGYEPDAVARTLGWLSLGLGAFEILRARPLVRALGGRRSGVLRLYGLREIVTGVGILNARAPALFLWGRVAGDALDIYSLLRGFEAAPRRGTRALALLSLAGIALADVLAARRVAAARLRRPPALFAARRSLTMHGTPDALLARWRDPAVLASVMGFLADLHPLADGDVRWVAGSVLGRDIPGGPLSWTTALTGLEDGIAWVTGGAGLPVSLAVSVVPAPPTLPDHAVVSLELRFGPADGLVGRVLAQMFGPLPLGPLVDKALHRFKSLVETGALPTVDPQPAGAR